MTKLNLSALKKKADILANPVLVVPASDSQMNNAPTMLPDISQTIISSNPTVSNVGTNVSQL